MTILVVEGAECVLRPSFQRRTTTKIFNLISVDDGWLVGWLVG